MAKYQVWKRRKGQSGKWTRSAAFPLRSDAVETTRHARNYGPDYNWRITKTK